MDFEKIIVLKIVVFFFYVFWLYCRCYSDFLSYIIYAHSRENIRIRESVLKLFRNYIIVSKKKSSKIYNLLFFPHTIKIILAFLGVLVAVYIAQTQQKR